MAKRPRARPERLVDAGGQLSACTISVESATYSPIVGTVGIVTWSTTLPSVDRAQIDFGLDTQYGLTAPADLAQDNYRTLLLGMKQNAGPYHFRISAWAGSEVCVSADQVFDSKTGASPSDLTPPVVISYDATALDGGFLLTVGYDANGPDDYVFIVDGDGDIVWWYQPTGFADLSAALMSYDGHYMWMAHANVPRVEARVGRVLMDGSGWERSSKRVREPGPRLRRAAGRPHHLHVVSVERVRRHRRVVARRHEPIDHQFVRALW